jgi:large subunit ribosomal protein L43
MATRGILQCTKLLLHYCEVGGSSRAIREYIGNGHLVAWAAAHPHIEIEVNRRNGHHPYVQADYLTKQKTNIHQVSVKNVEKWKEVE